MGPVKGPHERFVRVHVDLGGNNPDMVETRVRQVASCQLFQDCGHSGVIWLLLRSEQLNHRDGSGGLVGPGSYLPFVIVRLPCCRGSLDLDGKARHRRQSLLHIGFRFRRLALFRPGVGLALQDCRW